MSFLYHRGVYVTDKITGFKGVIAGRADYLTGCNQYLVRPPVDKDGKHVDGLWIDEHALEVDASKQQLKLERRVEQPPG